MNAIAPEGSAESVAPTSCEEQTVTRFDGEPDAELKAKPFECLVCLRPFGMLPFYGCCGACYTGSADVRAMVDEAHPQTVR